jgi:hypothetical protein
MGGKSRKVVEWRGNAPRVNVTKRCLPLRDNPEHVPKRNSLLSVARLPQVTPKATTESVRRQRPAAVARPRARKHDTGSASFDDRDADAKRVSGACQPPGSPIGGRLPLARFRSDSQNQPRGRSGPASRLGWLPVPTASLDQLDSPAQPCVCTLPLPWLFGFSPIDPLGVFEV